MPGSPHALRSLLAAGEPFIAADCYSALTGRIVQQVGFPAAYMGGHATGMMHYAVPDCGVLTTTEMVEQAARVAAAISIPLIVDADQAGESVADVHRTIRAYERVGVAGVHIEDEIPRSIRRSTDRCCRLAT
jgi:2-methylisocitrate lyase-like PEP mutase family enzyme